MVTPVQLIPVGLHGARTESPWFEWIGSPTIESDHQDLPTMVPPEISFPVHFLSRHILWQIPNKYKKTIKICLLCDILSCNKINLYSQSAFRVRWGPVVLLPGELRILFGRNIWNRERHRGQSREERGDREHVRQRFRENHRRSGVPDWWQAQNKNHVSISSIHQNGKWTLSRSFCVFLHR